MIVPALYETDDGRTGNGMVHPFCSDECLQVARRKVRGLGGALVGESHTEDFGFMPVCETCGTLLRPCPFVNWAQPCILVDQHKGDHKRSLEASMRTTP